MQALRGTSGLSVPLLCTSGSAARRRPFREKRELSGRFGRSSFRLEGGAARHAASPSEAEATAWATHVIAPGAERLRPRRRTRRLLRPRSGHLPAGVQALAPDEVRASLRTVCSVSLCAVAVAQPAGVGAARIGPQSVRVLIWPRGGAPGGALAGVLRSVRWRAGGGGAFGDCGWR
jgi:hypothetical protein